MKKSDTNDKDLLNSQMQSGSLLTRKQVAKILTEDEINFLKELREKFDSRVLYGVLLKP